MNSLADSMQCHGDSIRCYGAWHLMPGGKTSDPDFARRDVANALSKCRPRRAPAQQRASSCGLRSRTCPGDKPHGIKKAGAECICHSVPAPDLRPSGSQSPGLISQT